MKTLKTILALAILCIATSVNATVRTVSNNTNSPGQYTTISAAISAASTNDTIYVHGSTYTYGDITINKALTLVGPGHHPAKQNPLTATLGTVTVMATGSGGKLIGFIASSVIFPNGETITGFTIQRCNILGSLTCAGATSSAILISGCVFTSSGNDINCGSSSTNVSNWTINNNIFNGTINQFNSANGLTYVTHNDFFHQNPNGSSPFVNISYVIMNNNIFDGFSVGGQANSSCSANNNITYNCGAGCSFGIPGSGNLVNTDPQFYSYTTGNLFSFTNNITLNLGSPGLNAGNDGTDIGVFGGNTNVFSMSGEPAIPEITAFTLSSSVVVPNGSININVSSTRIQ